MPCGGNEHFFGKALRLVLIVKKKRPPLVGRFSFLMFQSADPRLKMGRTPIHAMNHCGFTCLVFSVQTSPKIHSWS